MDLLEKYIVELLHISEVDKNNLIDIYAKRNTTIELSSLIGYTYKECLDVIKKKIGKIGNTFLKDSSRDNVDQKIGIDSTFFDWQFLDGSKDKEYLAKYVDSIYKNISSKGFNPLFLSIGLLRWKVSYKDTNKIIETPLIIFPIKLIRSGQASPITIEFVDDDIYFNPCLYYKLLEQIPSDVVEKMPRPSGNNDNSLTSVIDLNSLTVDYFDKIEEYVKLNNKSQDTVFEIIKDKVFISEYNHEDICMYYDLKNHYNKVYLSDNVQKIFLKNDSEPIKNTNVSSLDLILPYDSIQEEIVHDSLIGNSMIIKGPPGTGKTLTIANMISSLISHGKKVLFSSKKISAMTEVYAKLPENIRNFSLLLEAETESQAANISPSKIKKELKRIYELKKDYQNHNKNRDCELKESASNKIFDSITKYYEFTNDNDLIEDSFYKALLEYYKYDSNLELLHLIDKDKAFIISKNDFDLIKNNIDSISSLLEILTNKYTHSIKKCPYFNIKYGADKEKVYDDFNSARSYLEEIYNLIKDNNIEFDNLTLMSLVWFLENNINKIQVEQILNINNLDSYYKNLYLALVDYLNIKDRVVKDVDIEFNKLIDYQMFLKNIELISDLSKDELELINSNLEYLKNNNSYYLEEKDVLKLKSFIELISNLENEKEKSLNDFYRVFKKDLDSETLTFIESSYNICLKNKGKEIKFFNFSANNAYKKLKGFSYLDDVTFDEICDSVIAYNSYLNTIKEISANKSNISRIIQKELNDSLYATLKVLIRYNENIKTVLSLVDNNYKKITSLASLLKQDNYTISDLNNVLSDLIISTRFNNLVDEIALGIEVQNREVFAKTILGLIELGSKNVDKVYNFLTFVKNNKDTLSKLIKKSTDLLNGLRPMFDDNYYVYADCDMTFEMIKSFISEVKNRELLSSYDRFVNIVKDVRFNELVDVKIVVERYVSNLDFYIDEKNEFKNIIMRSLYNDLIKAKITKYSDFMNQIALSLEDDTNKLYELYGEIEELNVLKNEDTLMSYINEHDEIYRALYNEKAEKNLRLLFKNEPEVLLKLKRNFILSPSTASLLFVRDDYESFDTVIIDEASQMLPVEMLPLLYRAKQCIIVGDEWQMPPIKHFKIKEVDTEFDNDEILSKEESALAIALNSKLLKTYELKCHYRSKTESLIKFSQEKYYPFMRTFPTFNPKKDDLGIEDIYIENGICEFGENYPEAKKVVEIIKNHFDRYYNPETNKLAVTLGVVAFGESQRDLILDLIKADSVLYERIRKLTNILDVPEKVFFVKAIEKVQGQECDHMILSLTYGKNKGGFISQSFGELNREFGDCIFNVAVTRSKSKIYVVHSINPEDITNKNVEFIQKYLFISRELSKFGKEQFIQEEPNTFYKNISEYLESIGIDKTRIVYNYGVTKGSIRIPIAILSSDYSKALCGLWAEKDISGKKYLDINCRYYNILKQNGWKFYNIYTYNWFYNNESEKKKIREFLENNI